MKEACFSSERLKALMEERGFDVWQLAKATGKSQQAVYDWLNGKIQPRFESLVRLCMVFGCELADLSDVPLPDESDLRPFETPIDFRRFLADIMRDYAEAYCIEVCTVFVNRLFPKGSYALVDPTQNEPDGVSIYAVSVNGEYPIFARVEMLASGMLLHPYSYDLTVQPIVVDYLKGETSDVIGKGVWFIQPLENIK